jgi:hypothetical protein
LERIDNDDCPARTVEAFADDGINVIGMPNLVRVVRAEAVKLINAFSVSS